jgi:hypothetical protein
MTFAMKVSANLIAHAFAAMGLMLSMTAKSQLIDGTKAVEVAQSKARRCIDLSDPEGWSVDVWDPGYYCLAHNLHQSWPLVKFPHQRVPLSPMISIYGSDVTIDLKGRRLSSTTPIHSGVYTNFSSDEALLPTIIKNGEITTLDIPTVRMVDRWNLGNQRFGRTYPLSASHGDISLYKPTVFVLENLTLKGNQHVIIMQGKRNIIRNCTIIGGNGTVNVYGPNLLFEGNTIILNAKAPKTRDGEQPTALYLEDAANSVVRNNKIVIKGSGVPNPNAIVLFNSPNVLLEHNIIRGTRTVYKALDERSSVSEIGNDAK